MLILRKENPAFPGEESGAQMSRNLRPHRQSRRARARPEHFRELKPPVQRRPQPHGNAGEEQSE